MRFLVLISLSIVSVAQAGEFALLSGGGRLRVDRHEVAGSKMRLFTGGGTIEMNAAEVTGFEPEDYVPPAKATPQPAPQVTAATPAPSARQLADAAAQKYGLPQSLVRSVMKAESGFQPNAVSPKGALGLMQLMPATAQELGADPKDPAQNVDAGARYLRDLLEKFHGGLWHALAAYNAGPDAVEKYHGVPPYPETINYVKRITRDFEKSE